MRGQYHWACLPWNRDNGGIGVCPKRLLSFRIVSWPGESVLAHVLLNANLPIFREKEIRVYEYVYEYGRGQQPETKVTCGTTH